jgi:hypothetical protein
MLVLVNDSCCFWLSRLKLASKTKAIPDAVAIAQLKPPVIVFFGRGQDNQILSEFAALNH